MRSESHFCESENHSDIEDGAVVAGIVWLAVTDSVLSHWY